MGLFDHLVNKLAEEVVKQATGIGKDMARTAGGKIMDGVVSVGKEQLSLGVESAKKTISNEMLKSNPQRLAGEIIKMAGKNRGELSAEQVATAFEMPLVSAMNTLNELIRKSTCFRRQTTNGVLYIFPAFRNKKQIKACEYCDNKIEMDAVPGNTCPTCGAVMQTITEIL